MTLAVEIHNLLFSWPGAKLPALVIPELQVRRGEKLFMLGASGSGKSTLLNLVGGMLLPQQGSVSVLEQDLAALGGRARDRFRARHLGFIFQQFNLIPYLDVETNIALASHFAGGPWRQRRQAIQALLTALGMSPDLLSRRADALSVGQQQRVAMARALINEPEILIADEPTSALDQDVRDEFIDLLTGMARERETTVVFVSHDRSLMRHFDRVLKLENINQAALYQAAREAYSHAS